MNDVIKKFNKMGVDAVIRPGRLSIDIKRDPETKAEFYDIQTDVELLVLDSKPKDRHLLLMARDRNAGTKRKYLCGHDERAWFVAGVDGLSVSSVQTAKDSLKPSSVENAEDRRSLKRRDKNKRRNAARVRQGEWFFIPAPSMNPPARMVLHNEPIRRGRSRPHMCQDVFRTGGQTVYVSPDHPNGLSEGEYKKLIKKDSIKALAFRMMVRDAVVYVRGTVKAPDHEPLYLKEWHQVVPNTESSFRSDLAFLD